MSAVNWWQRRNERWASTHLTPKKYAKIQRNWMRVKRFGDARYVALVVLAGSLCCVACMLIFSYIFGTFQLIRKMNDRPFLYMELRDMVGISVFMALIFGVFHYVALRESARWPAPASGNQRP